MEHIKKAEEMLKGWVNYSLNELYVCPDRQDLVCYGSGYNGWGMQAHQKALAAYTIAATSNFLQESEKSKLLQISLKMLRYMLETHIEGTYECLEGVKWGHTWISILGIERSMHAIEVLEDYMSNDDKALLKKVFISEANWIMDFYDIKANAINAHGNRPESNIWNGAFLHRVAMMYPDTVRADEYKEKGTRYLVNSISVPEDKFSDRLYDGKPVSQWFIGNNFFESYSLDHHGYLNIGYMAICLSNIAILHFSFKKKGLKAPEALYHHVSELWQLLKTCIFDDARIIRIGGDTRIRYCYCQDYVLPMLTFVRDYLKDEDAIELEKACVELFYKEYQHNNDGSFLSKRCNNYKIISPTYYTRLESDRSSVLSMLLNWNEIATVGDRKIERFNSWYGQYHGGFISNGKNRFASWAWRGADGAQGLCLPMGESNLAEWNDNLAGEIKGKGFVNKTNCIYNKGNSFDGGFITFGILNKESSFFLREQQNDQLTAEEKVTYAVLPDDYSVVVMQFAKTNHRVYLNTVKGLKYNIPNDIYNDFVRTYYYKDKADEKQGLQDDECVINTDSDWVNVDNKLGIIKGYGGNSLKIYRPGDRNVAIKKQGITIKETKMLWSDVICGKCEITPGWADKNEVILDEGAVVVAGIDAKATEVLAAEQCGVTVKNTELTRSIVTKGFDGNVYLVLSNFGDRQQQVKIQSDNGKFRDLVDNKAYTDEISIAKNSAMIFVIE